ncbi:TetR/AcrR family transcriptional regulator [Mesohalobacter halotolerans]|uniref:TetR/AcrR family transcriptional regulator n=1 Tax=Mesohalobacter halotolerans TaxID=1883405 RepID=A0A4U5TNZ0_9FLAO|nr:TetR family transcriptional regulator C-terminal domain-containing protein [Mesohalobacter halotolerans]MBS3738340.1 TetR/AcrR family transcriptional regulator [Psychroflexus sp.]TKS55613.1 TetR/AcrR family transcriptional regulator [Mesohalobacter halotolerans]
MATQTKTKKKSSKPNIVEAYMNYVLEHEHEPKSVYKFAKDLKIKEADFYKHFGSFKGLKQHIWDSFYQNTIEVISKADGYEEYSSREKMLIFFYTFFEVLTANRSYVLFTLDENNDMTKNMAQLKSLRKHIKSFAKELIEIDNDDKQISLLKRNESVFSEGAWIQFMFLLKFWIDDNSAEFEKTDVAIEKSVNTIFDVFDNTPLEQVIDFGKFLFKERMQ